jgi:hypothetical protein
MKTKIIVLKALDLSLDEHVNSPLQTTLESSAREQVALTLPSKTNLHLKHTFATWRAAALPWSRSSSELLPGPDGPGFFMNQCRTSSFSLASEFPRSKAVQNDTEFHDSESGDIYDLYNACNGIVGIDGFLDVEQLNNYTPDEAEELNVPRLGEVWEHTKTGCLKCREIVRALNKVRRAVSDVADVIDPRNDEESDGDQITSI